MGRGVEKPSHIITLHGPAGASRFALTALATTGCRPVGMLAVLAALPGAALAASGERSTATGHASATVVEPIVLTHTDGAALRFGTIVSGESVSVAIDANGTARASVTGAQMPGSATTADQFHVTGGNERSFAIITSRGTVHSAANSIAFETQPSAPSAESKTGGGATFSVGGSMTLSGREPPGSYRGEYIATIAYD